MSCFTLHAGYLLGLTEITFAAKRINKILTTLRFILKLLTSKRYVLEVLDIPSLMLNQLGIESVIICEILKISHHCYEHTLMF